jgi:protein MpaA
MMLEAFGSHLNRMEIIEVPKGFALGLEFRGRLDMSTSALTQDKLVGLIAKGHNRLALDLSHLEYISSAGLRVLLTILKKVKVSNGKIVVFGFRDEVKRIFEIAGFTALFPMYATAAEALRAFRWSHPLAKFVRAERQGPNDGAYFGETIDIDALQNEILRAGREHHWNCEPFLDEEDCKLFALFRLSPTATKTIYLCSGMHGDEPAPPLAMLNLLWQNQWSADWNIYLVPCLNPAGFRANQRANAQGIDLNRDYCDSKARETRAHVAWLEKQPTFSVAGSLHEDWESAGFYLYQFGPLAVEPVIGHILEHVAKVCPIDQSPEIDHLPAEGGELDLAFQSLQINEALIDGLAESSAATMFIRRSGSTWTEQSYLVNRKTRVSYTFETASAMPLEVRVKALTQAVIALLNCPHEIF